MSTASNRAPSTPADRAATPLDLLEREFWAQHGTTLEAWCNANGTTPLDLLAALDTDDALKLRAALAEALGISSALLEQFLGTKKK